MKYSIYAIQHGLNDGPIKIGITTGSPQTRLDALQTGNPHKLELLGALVTEFPLIEREIHDSLSRWRLNGEWFSCSKQVEHVVDMIVHNNEMGLLDAIGMVKVISLYRVRQPYGYLMDAMGDIDMDSEAEEC